MMRKQRAKIGLDTLFIRTTRISSRVKQTAAAVFTRSVDGNGIRPEFDERKRVSQNVGLSQTVNS
jgi:hypothetical protein